MAIYFLIIENSLCFYIVIIDIAFTQNGLRLLYIFSVRESSEHSGKLDKQGTGIDATKIFRCYRDGMILVYCGIQNSQLKTNRCVITL